MIVRPRGKLQVEAEGRNKITYTDILEKREIKLTDSTKLVFSATESSTGVVNFDVRTYITKGEEEIPTRKGINFNVENLEEFLTVVLEMNKELIEKNI